MNYSPVFNQSTRGDREWLTLMGYWTLGRSWNEGFALTTDLILFLTLFLILILLLILIYKPLRKAERRFCAVGLPAGSRESRVGPWMARHGVPTEQSRSEGT